MPYASDHLAAELSLFDQALNWKSYWTSIVGPYVRGQVLEVGAGMGGSVPLLVANASDWLCLEPDAFLASQLRERIAAGELPPQCRLELSTLQGLAPGSQFDAILYADVMEHVRDDGVEARLAAERLAPGGALIILAPAHQFLFSPFDEAVGHYRRYSKSSLRAIVPSQLEQVTLIYLDSLGALLSLGNRFALRSSRPKAGSVRFWNNWVVPASRRLDPLFGYCVGKSVLGIWRRPTA